MSLDLAVSSLIRYDHTWKPKPGGAGSSGNGGRPSCIDSSSLSIQSYKSSNIHFLVNVSSTKGFSGLGKNVPSRKTLNYIIFGGLIWGMGCLVQAPARLPNLTVTTVTHKTSRALSLEVSHLWPCPRLLVPNNLVPVQREEEDVGSSPLCACCDSAALQLGKCFPSWTPRSHRKQSALCLLWKCGSTWLSDWTYRYQQPFNSGLLQIRQQLFPR